MYSDIKYKIISFIAAIFSIPIVKFFIIFIFSIPKIYLLTILSVFIVNTIIFLVYVKKRQNNISCSVVRVAFTVSTIVGLLTGTLAGPELSSAIFKTKYFFILNFIVNFSLSELIFFTILYLGNYLTDNSLFLNFKTNKPDYEKVFNRMTVFLSIVTISPFLSQITKVDKSFPYLYTYIFGIIIFIFYLYLIWGFLKSKNMQVDWAEFTSIFAKSLIKEIVVYAGLGAIPRLPALVKGYSTTLILIIDLWSYIHNIIKKEKLNSGVPFNK